ncbi:MAG: DUF1566 domain-containing protein [Rhodocyclales bacterium]|nr:DUF1566 domain-containing protein [Rhodocyclales bacterium]
MNTTTLDVGGAQLTVATEALFRAWLEKNLGITQPAVPQYPAPAANEGERYAGTIIRADGSGHHIYRLPMTVAIKVKWAEAMKFAEEQGAELPDRVEGAMLFATREKGEFEPEWYWTREQYAGYDGYAWCQYFGDGNQYSLHKDDDARVVLVRRVAIQSIQSLTRGS